MADLHTILSEGMTADQSLSSMYEIEDLLFVIDELNRKIDYYKEMKKHRIQIIDDKISNLSAKVDCLRCIILNTMRKVAPNEKTLDFPGIGKVTRRKPKETLTIVDQDKVISFLESKGVKDQVVKVVQTIDKRALSSLVQKYNKTGETIPGVVPTVGDESISITLEKPKTDDQTSTSSARVDLDTLDSLLV